jgi:hypothetical protein
MCKKVCEETLFKFQVLLVAFTGYIWYMRPSKLLTCRVLLDNATTRNNKKYTNTNIK